MAFAGVRRLQAFSARTFNGQTFEASTHKKTETRLCSFPEAELCREFPVHYESFPDATLSSCTVFQTLASNVEIGRAHV